jgi:hypothetical protein
MQATHPSYQGAHGESIATSPARQAYQALHVGFIVAPVLAGLDKFTNLLTDWTKYLAPSVANVLPFDARTFMYGVGVVEVIAGLIVAIRPRIGGYIVSAWLLGIILNLLLHTQRYYDVALRDLGLAIGAFALARLSTSLGKK